MMHSTASRLIKDGSNPIDYPPAKLTHLDDSGRPSMVDVSSKSVTKRTATAEGRIHLNDIAFSLISDALSAQAAAAVSSSSEQSKAIAKALSKGPVLLVAELAGIHAAKQTSSLIPLCHPLSLSHISVSLTPHAEDRTVRCKATVRCEGRTGVEMEALTAASVALLTVWDMVKAVAGREMRIDGVKVVEKTGGKSGNWVRVEDTPGGR